VRNLERKRKRKPINALGEGKPAIHTDGQARHQKNQLSWNATSPDPVWKRMSQNLMTPLLRAHSNPRSRIEFAGLSPKRNPDPCEKPGEGGRNREREIENQGFPSKTR